MAKYKLSQGKINFYSSLSPEQFDYYSSELRKKAKSCKKLTRKSELQNEFVALMDLYLQIHQIRIGTIVEYIVEDWHDWDDSETDLFMVRKFFNIAHDDIITPICSVSVDDEDCFCDEPLLPTAYKPVSLERLQWLVEHYPEKMAVLWSDKSLNLSTNPLFKGKIIWPEKIVKEKELLEDLKSIGL
jgi:hypothetical protein